jgi:hypothetical protein
MTDQPITPPPELVEQWVSEFWGYAETGKADASQLFIATRAAQWGADCELEKCCKMLYDRYDRVRHATGFPGSDISDWLRAARRPKPPSLKEQALETLQRISKDKYPCNYQEDSDWDTIRRALEQLPDNN